MPDRILRTREADLAGNRGNIVPLFTKDKYLPQWQKTLQYCDIAQCDMTALVMNIVGARRQPISLEASITRFDGIVVANFGAAAAILDANGQLCRAIPLKKLPLIVAGDKVVCEGENYSDLRVTALSPRSSALERPDRKGVMRPLAANLSQLVIVSAIKPPAEPMLIDQFCVVAETAGIDAMIVMNKSDLATQKELDNAKQLLEIYQNIGYKTALVNTTSDEGLAPLWALIQSQSSVLVGQSGVGKSSIVQRLLPDLDIRVGAISEATGIGSHTTTVSYRYELGNNGVLIDSPGVRQFQVDHLMPVQISQGYREMSELSRECRFGDCLHDSEPDCAVKQALAEGKVDQLRYDNFIKLQQRDA